jgi:hypothetical protein
MAKVNLTLSASANVLALINAANPALNATDTQVTLGTPSVAAGTGGRNTSLIVTAVSNQGFSGEQIFAYTRQALASGAAIATAKAVPFAIAPGDTNAQILTKAATALGLLESELTLANIVQPVNETTPGSADVVANVASLLYTGTYAATLTVPDADVPLDEAATVTDLSGFDAEA